jgi:hypothetical protein
MTFKSRYDTWLRIIFWINNLLLLASLVALLMDRELSSFIVAVFVAIVLAGVLWMQFATYYRVDDTVLFVRCGPLRWTIPLSTITSATLTDDPTAGPALSLQRVRVEFTKNGSKDEIFISPDDREAFIASLGLGAPASRAG